MTTEDKRTYLEQSFPLSKHLVRTFPNVNVLAHHIFSLHPGFVALTSRARNAYPKERVIESITNFILNLYLGWKTNQRVRVSLKSGDYRNPERYGRLFYRYRLLTAVLDTLEAAGLVIRHPGYYDQEAGLGKQTRIDPTPALVSLLEEYEVTQLEPSILTDPDRGDCIILHDADGILADYAETPYTVQARILLDRYNKFLDRAGIFIPIWDKMPFLSSKLLERIFRPDFQHGGRYYAGYQCIPWSEETRRHYHASAGIYRSQITFAGEKCAELDFSGLHPTMLYHILGLEMEGKAYAIGSSHHKDFVKPYILICFNAKSVRSAKLAWVKEIENRQKDERWNHKRHTRKELMVMAKDIHDIFVIHHAKIASYVGSGIGTELQLHDSEIMSGILAECMKAGIPALPVHDSIVIPESKKAKAREIMIAAYQTHMMKAFQMTFTPTVVVDEK